MASSEGEVVISPLRIYQTSKKDFILNLNPYRNAHFRTLNSMKKRYKELMAKQILMLPSFKKVKLVYTLYPKDRRKCDVSNICSIHDKFFSDALVEYGKIEDDNYLYIPEIDYRFGGLDKENPRVEIKIIEIGI